jgi:hypothetical protein
MNLIKYIPGNKAITNPIGFDWFNNRFNDAMFLDLLNKVFPLSIFLADKYGISSQVLVNRSITSLFNCAIEQSKGEILRDLKRWFIVLRGSPQIEPAYQYYMYVIKDYCKTHSVSKFDIEEKINKHVMSIAISDLGRQFILKFKKDLVCERNINIFSVENGRLNYQPQSVIDKSVDSYFNSFNVYDDINDLMLEYVGFVKNIKPIIQSSKGVADLVVLNSSYRIYSQYNALSKDKATMKALRDIKKPFNLNL